MSKLLQKMKGGKEGGAAASAGSAAASSAAAEAPPAVSTSDAYSRVLKDYSLLMEYKRLKQLAPTGIYVLPAADTLRRWSGVIFVRNGHYRGGVFKFLIQIPDGYPDVAPTVNFLSEIFHPLIHADTGLLDLTPQFPAWSGRPHFIVLLLSYVKKIFYKTELWDGTPDKQAANPKAQKLWLRSKEEYIKLCEQNSLKSQSPDKLYGPPAGTGAERGQSSIVFEKPRPAHDEAYRRIIREDKEKGLAGSSYLDWFTDGVYKLDNQLGPAPAAMPPTAYEPPAPVTLSTVTTAAGAQLLGLMSPISPLVKMQEAEAEAEAVAKAAAAEGRTAGEDETATTLTVAELATIT